MWADGRVAGVPELQSPAARPCGWLAPCHCMLLCRASTAGLTSQQDDNMFKAKPRAGWNAETAFNLH